MKNEETKMQKKIFHMQNKTFLPITNVKFFSKLNLVVLNRTFAKKQVNLNNILFDKIYQYQNIL